MIKEAIAEWLREILVGGITSNLSGMFDNVNQKVGEIAGQVGTTPQAWNSSIYNMIRTLSDSVIVPIAGVILAFVMTLELIQLITDKNNLHDIDTWMFFKMDFQDSLCHSHRHQHMEHRYGGVRCGTKRSQPRGWRYKYRTHP
jgi:hypothetical protein